MKRRDSARELALRFVFAAIACLIARSSPAENYTLFENDSVDFDVSTRKGLRFDLKDAGVRFRVGGRLHLDGLVAEDDSISFRENDFEVRRARLYLRGRSDAGFSFVVDGELAERRRGWRNLGIRYAPDRSWSIRAGNFVAPFGLEEVAASNHSTFLERSIASSFAPGFQTGVRLDANGHFGDARRRHRWVASTAFTTEPLGEASNDRRGTRHFGSVTRLVYAPIARRGTVAHFGSAFEYRDVRNGRRWRSSTRPESGLLPSLLNTSRLADVDRVMTLGVEFLAIRGPITFQTEFVRAWLDRDRSRPDPEFEGGYAQLSWVVTGESRRYRRRSGTLHGIHPERKWGAIELAVRASVLDLNDETVNGGSARNMTIGASWYVLRNMRFMANYTYGDLRTRSNRDQNEIHVAQFRWLVFF